MLRRPHLQRQRPLSDIADRLRAALRVVLRLVTVLHVDRSRLRGWAMPLPDDVPAVGRFVHLVDAVLLGPVLYRGLLLQRPSVPRLGPIVLDLVSLLQRPHLLQRLLRERARLPQLGPVVLGVVTVLQRPQLLRRLLRERSDLRPHGRWLLDVVTLLQRPVVSVGHLRRRAHVPVVGSGVRLGDDALLRERTLLRRQHDERHAHLSLHLRGQRHHRSQRVGVLRRPGAKQRRRLCLALRGNGWLVRQRRDLLRWAHLQRLGHLRGAARLQTLRRLLQRPLRVLRERARLRLRRHQPASAVPHRLRATPRRSLEHRRLLPGSLPEQPRLVRHVTVPNSRRPSPVMVTSALHRERQLAHRRMSTDEQGRFLTGTSTFWTGMSNDASTSSLYGHCSSWTSSSGNGSAGAGTLLDSASASNTCSNTYRLLCLEQ